MAAHDLDGFDCGDEGELRVADGGTAPRYTEPVNRIVAVATKRPLHQPDTSWVDYWRGRPIEERLAMATELSLECSDATPDTRLHRVHRVLRST